LLGLFPVVGGVLQAMPKPVLGGATLIMFGTVAIAGIKILAEAGLHRRNMLIVSISLGLGLGVAGVPEVLSAMPDVLKNIFGSPITIGAFSAILLNLFLPREPSEADVFDPEELIEDAVGTNTLSVNIPDYREHDGHRRDAMPQPAGADFKG
ncbi:MAG TPA: xanthine permease XanP, partial [Pseudomonas sp.]|nr:xanthine permease XanP [Pseudomonas sp.]